VTAFADSEQAMSQQAGWPQNIGGRTVVTATDLECTYGLGRRREVPALGPISLRVRAGEFVSLVGPSGCGKSTFVKVLAGLTAPTHGELRVHIDGSSPTSIATVFQDFGIFPWKTVQANVELGLRVRGESARVRRVTAADWLSRFGLRDFADSYPAELSGGMRQRVAIARALVLGPEILLMDEPFASLDAQLRELMQGELLKICEEDQRTVVFITHSLDEAIVLSDRVLVMTARPGRILTDRTIPFARPRDPRVRTSAEFGAVREHLWGQLREEVRAQLGETAGVGQAS
jgi:NitT/TauT family transport system ATP-binding protein